MVSGIAYRPARPPGKGEEAMSAKSVWLSGLAAAFLGLGVARGQGPDSATGGQPVLPQGAAASAESVPIAIPVLAASQDNNNAGTTNNNLAGNDTNSPDAGPLPGTGKEPPGGRPVYQSGWSSWLMYPRTPGCCGPTGDGPIGWEVYFRSGLNFPIGGGLFNTELDPGWAVQGGGRVLFFNPPADAAWTLDVGLSNVFYNDGQRKRTTNVLVPVVATNLGGGTTITPTPTDVMVRDLNETFLNASFGREWYLMGAADCKGGGPVWRVGTDGGGSWGSAKVDLLEPPLPATNNQGQNQRAVGHITKEVGGLTASVHSDLECPCGSYVIQFGTRLEYGYIWTHILQTQMDVQSLNLLFTLGVRY
jgi:hypothetical protein